MQNASEVDHSGTASTRLGPNTGQDRPEIDEKGCTGDAACGCYRVVETPYTGELRARGVVAAIDIHRGQLVEVADCIFIPRQEYEEHLRHTVLKNYLFRTSNGDMLLGLGAASLFNHSRCPTLDYRIDKANLMIRFFSARDIKKGEELTFFYGNTWFEDKAAQKGQGDQESTMHEHMDDEHGFLAAVSV